MKSTELALSTPPDFLRYKAVLLSAPTDMRGYDRAVQPANGFQPLQCLFGYDAQLQSFAASLRRAGAEPWFLPSPDMFASSNALIHCLNAAGGEVTPSAPLLHLCFGMPGAARVLKGGTNLAVLAGIADEVPLQSGYHPFESSNNLPAAIEGVLSYDRLRNPVKTSDGRDLPTGILDEAFADEPLSSASLEPVPDHGYEAHLRAEFRIQSVLEFTAAAWEENSPGGPGQSLDFRRALIRRNVVLPGQNNPLRFSLLPWNMANGRSMVPDLAVRLSSDKERGEYEHGIILMPYNEGDTGIPRLRTLVNECRANAAPGCAETIFLMRVTSMRSIQPLRAMVTNSWLDGSDPEWRWNARRLARLGFKTVLIAGPGLGESFNLSPREQGVDAVFPAEESRVVRSPDGVGEGLWRCHALSTRGMRRLLQYTREIDLVKGQR